MVGALVHPHGLPAVSIFVAAVSKTKICYCRDKLSAPGPMPLGAAGTVRFCLCTRRAIYYRALVHCSCRAEFASLQRMRYM